MITLLWKGEEISLYALALRHGFAPSTLRNRLRRGWPVERLLDPVGENKHVKTPAVRAAVKPVAALALQRGYSDGELLELYRMFCDKPDALRRLADFMASDIPSATERVRKWKKEGRI